MNLTISRALFVMAALVSPCLGAEGPERNPSSTDPKRSTVNVQALLEAGLAAGELPAGMIVRVSSCEGGLREERPDNPYPPSRIEAWEFSAKQVRRKKDADSEEPTVLAAKDNDSRPFDSKTICRDLLDGKALEIQAKKGTGPHTVMLESPYDMGTRSIEVVWQGKSVLVLIETNGPAFVAYPETDARAFGKLYEQLAGRARASFANK